MAQVIHAGDAVRSADVSAPVRHAYQAYQLLHFGFAIAPIVAGLDKFFNKLTEWDMYLAPFFARMIGGHESVCMEIAGVVEIIAGVGVIFKPRIFAYVVAAWLACIIVNLLMVPGFYDIALRDFGLLLGALALGRLSMEHGN
ncbi:MAG TPA: hypothetical protein VKX17_20045 [Planctomycetota bacterium]|nr:hypothetical protein [Planctomycetota bacterium]